MNAKNIKIKWKEIDDGLESEGGLYTITKSETNEGYDLEKTQGHHGQVWARTLITAKKDCNYDLRCSLWDLQKEGYCL